MKNWKLWFTGAAGLILVGASTASAGCPWEIPSDSNTHNQAAMQEASQGASPGVGTIPVAAQSVEKGVLAPGARPRISHQRLVNSAPSAAPQAVPVTTDNNQIKKPASESIQWAQPPMNPLNLSYNSALLYEHREFDGPDGASYNRVGASIGGGFSLGEKIPVDINIPIDRVDFKNQVYPKGGPQNQNYNAFDFTRVGIIVTPRYEILNQARDGVDLAAGITTFYMHTFMDEHRTYNVDEKTQDSDYLGAGPLVTAKKDFESFSLSGGLLAERGYNMQGRKESTGHNYVDIYKAAMNVGVPIGDRWVVNTFGSYNYVDGLDAGMDRDYVTAGVGVTWLIKDGWAIDFGVSKDFFYEDAENIELTTGLTWNF